MKVKSALIMISGKLETAIPSDNHEIICCLKSTWDKLKRFSKTIDSSATIYIDELLNNCDAEKIIISQEMKEDAMHDLNRLKEEINNVYFCFKLYYGLVEDLLIYHRSDECCHLCEGQLNYYFNDVSNSVLKECATCGRLYDIDMRLVEFSEVGMLRPANRDELLINKIIK